MKKFLLLGSLIGLFAQCGCLVIRGHGRTEVVAPAPAVVVPAPVIVEPEHHH